MKNRCSGVVRIGMVIIIDIRVIDMLSFMISIWLRVLVSNISIYFVDS